MLGMPSVFPFLTVRFRTDGPSGPRSVTLATHANVRHDPGVTAVAVRRAGPTWWRRRGFARPVSCSPPRIWTATRPTIGWPISGASASGVTCCTIGRTILRSAGSPIAGATRWATCSLGATRPPASPWRRGPRYQDAWPHDAGRWTAIQQTPSPDAALLADPRLSAGAVPAALTGARALPKATSGSPVVLNADWQAGWLADWQAGGQAG